MKTRFAYELIIGIIGFVATLWFGSVGMVALALLAIHPFIGRRNPFMRGDKEKWDEREYQLFYKAGNFTAGFTIVALVIIFEIKDISINNHLINDNWLVLSASSFIAAHGLSCLIIFKKG